MSTESMHPLDAAEIKLKETARVWRYSEKVPGDFSSGDPDKHWQALKEAARTYGETWHKYVAPAPDTK